jgi:hypothetical protein
VLFSARDRRWVTVGGEDGVGRKRVVKRYYQVVEEARNTRGIRKR